MISNITKRSCLPVIGVIAVMLIFMNAPTECYGQCDCINDRCINIDIAPNTLNLAREGTVVTVHTDIHYGDVDVNSIVTLNGVPIEWSFPDDCGNFVAKISVSNIIETLEPGSFNIFVLEGTTSEQNAFCGEQIILVVEDGRRGPVEKQGNR